MNRKFLVIAVALLALALLVTYVSPVFAATKVSVVFNPAQPIVTTGGTTKTTPSGIMHVKGAERTAVAKLKIGSDTYIGTIHVDLDYEVNPITMTTTQFYHKMRMTFPAQFDLEEEGVFEGVLKWTASYNAPWVGLKSVIGATLSMHGVLQGSGGFEGCTLLVDLDAPYVSNSWLLMH